MKAMIRKKRAGSLFRSGILSALGLVGLFGLTLGTQGLAREATYKAGEVIVKYRSDVNRDRVTMNALYDELGVTEVKRYRGIMKGIEQLVFNPDVSVQERVAQLNQNPLVEYAQPNYILYAFPEQVDTKDGDQPPGGGIPCIPGYEIPGCTPIGNPGNPGNPGGPGGEVPCLFPGIPFPPGCKDDGSTPGNPGNPGNPPATDPAPIGAPAEVDPPVADPSLNQAYGIGKIGAPAAWEHHKGSQKMVVAVIDTGIDYNHEDLSFNVWRNPSVSDKNDLVGYDFVHNDGLPFDDHAHGTHCSGVVGAVGGNGKGISGVNQRVSVMGVKFLSGSGEGTTADAIRAIDYAVQHGAKVLSNSWGGKGDDGNAALRESIERARAADVLFIAAAGNDSTDNDKPDPSYPAAFDNDNLIAVAATDQNDRLASFSNYGKRTTHLAAPGVNVYSTTPGNKYQKMSGTSMACPHVAGAAALVWSANPKLTYRQVKDILLNSVDKVPALAEKTVTGGRLNVQRALQMALDQD